MLPHADRDKVFVGGVAMRVSGRGRGLIGSRVFVVAFVRTTPTGLVDAARTPMVYVRPAENAEPNGCAWSAQGQLRRADASEQLIVLRILSRNTKFPYSLRVRGTSTMLRDVNSDWSVVEVTGGLVGSMLVADRVARAPAMYVPRAVEPDRTETSPTALVETRSAEPELTPG